MGLTAASVGIHAVDCGPEIRKQNPNDRLIAIAGNPNVGKSTLFNGLTGLRQHTGNWPGKTVTNAFGTCSTASYRYIMADIPGTYSLLAHSAEEEVARNFLCFHSPDAVVAVCDAACLERNLNLVLQILEITPHVLVCVNLMDEAARRKIRVDLKRLSQLLGVPVLGTVGHKKESLEQILKALDQMMEMGSQNSSLQEEQSWNSPSPVTYSEPVEEAVARLIPVLKQFFLSHAQPLTAPFSLQATDLKAAAFGFPLRWLAFKLLEQDTSLLEELRSRFGLDPDREPILANALLKEQDFLRSRGLSAENWKDHIVSSLVCTAESICKKAVSTDASQYDKRDYRIDQILTSKWAGYPAMLLLLALIFWITITGANYPSQLLSSGMFWLQGKLTELLALIHTPAWLSDLLLLGVYRTAAWVISVMLPPMAIFFPLFTLLEDSGYLPRIAYNLDKPFRKCCSCGKQSLCMCMGFGCNAVGVAGCRIIDSPRERLIAILTNNFVPCNGRFPTLIALITIFFAGIFGGLFSSLLSALMLTGLVLLGILMTFAVSRLLSGTILKGIPSSFTLELPSYRKPQVGKVIVRSILDRTLFVLGRAVAVAAPAGLVLWLLANYSTGGASLLQQVSSFLDPFARMLGLDGAILIAFILGLPANEIVLPIILMVYLAQGSLQDFSSLAQLKDVLILHGWTPVTAICTMVFSLMHWPCSTTLLTIKKETGSLKWMLLACILPTAAGMALCFLIHGLSCILAAIA